MSGWGWTMPKSREAIGRPLLVRTESGSTYEVTDQTIKRLRPVGRGALRQDGETLNVVMWVTPPIVGKRMHVGLSVLSPPQFDGANTTFRLTTPVTEVIEMS